MKKKKRWFWSHRRLSTRLKAIPTDCLALRPEALRGIKVLHGNGNWGLERGSKRPSKAFEARFNLAIRGTAILKSWVDIKWWLSWLSRQRLVEKRTFKSFNEGFCMFWRVLDPELCSVVRLVNLPFIINDPRVGSLGCGAIWINQNKHNCCGLPLIFSSNFLL